MELKLHMVKVKPKQRGNGSPILNSPLYMTETLASGLYQPPLHYQTNEDHAESNFTFTVMVLNNKYNDLIAVMVWFLISQPPVTLNEITH